MDATHNKGVAMMHDLKPIEYLYRWHTIRLVANEWEVWDEDGDLLFSSESIDDCTAAIDGVMDEVEP